MAPHLHRLLEHPLLLLLPVLDASTGVRRTLVVRGSVKEHIQVAPPALASEVSVVRGRDEADRLRRPRIHVAQGMSTLLDYVRFEFVIVIDDDVMSRPNMPLETAMGLVDKKGREESQDAERANGSPSAVPANAPAGRSRSCRYL